MPSYFLRCTTNGILVLSHRVDFKIISSTQNFPALLPVLYKSVTMKNGQIRNITSEALVRVGFFACKDPKELGYEYGEEIPVTITNADVNINKNDVAYFPECRNVCWATPD